MCMKTTKAEKFLTIVTILTKFYLKLNFFHKDILKQPPFTF